MTLQSKLRQAHINRQLLFLRSYLKICARKVQLSERIFRFNQTV